VSPGRTAAEVERGIETSRTELVFAIQDLRESVREASDVRRRAEDYRDELVARVQREGDDLLVVAAASGFVAGGGVQALVRVPGRLVRVVFGYPTSRSRLESAMKEDGYSRQLGRSLAAVASADRHMRSRRYYVWRAVRPTPRRLLMIASAAGSAYVSKLDEDTRRRIEGEARAIVQELTAELAKRIDAIGTS
jgi:hypothetical protein